MFEGVRAVGFGRDFFSVRLDFLVWSMPICRVPICGVPILLVQELSERVHYWPVACASTVCRVTRFSSWWRSDYLMIPACSLGDLDVTFMGHYNLMRLRHQW